MSRFARRVNVGRACFATVLLGTALMLSACSEQGGSGTDDADANPSGSSGVERVVEPAAEPAPPAAMSIGLRVTVFAFPTDLAPAAAGAISDFFGSPGSPVITRDDYTMARELFTGLGIEGVGEPIATQTASLTTGERGEVSIQPSSGFASGLVLEVTPRLDEGGAIELIYSFRSADSDTNLVTDGLSLDAGRVGRLSRQAVVRAGQSVFAVRGVRGSGDGDRDLLIVVSLDELGG